MDHIPTNAEAAHVFDDIAGLLEAQGENPFKIRAYRSAARTLYGLSEPVADIEARGELPKISGFGEAIVGKTREILQTGTCALYERLKLEAAREAEDPFAEDGDAPAAPLAAPAVKPGLGAPEPPSPW